MKTTITTAKNIVDSYNGLMRCYNGGTREENERAFNYLKERLKPIIENAKEVSKTPSKALLKNESLLELLKSLETSFKRFCEGYEK